MIEVITRTYPVPIYIAIPLRVSFFVGVHFLFGIFTFSTAFRMVLIFKVYVTCISSNTFSYGLLSQDTKDKFQSMMTPLRLQRSTTWTTRGCFTWFLSLSGFLLSSAQPLLTSLTSFSMMVSEQFVEDFFVF